MQKSITPDGEGLCMPALTQLCCRDIPSHARPCPGSSLHPDASLPAILLYKNTMLLLHGHHANPACSSALGINSARGGTAEKTSHIWR